MEFVFDDSEVNMRDGNENESGESKDGGAFEDGILVELSSVCSAFGVL